MRAMRPGPVSFPSMPKGPSMGKMPKMDKMAMPKPPAMKAMAMPEVQDRGGKPPRPKRLKNA